MAAGHGAPGGVEGGGGAEREDRQSGERCGMVQMILRLTPHLVAGGQAEWSQGPLGDHAT